MGSLRRHPPVSLICGILTADCELLQPVEAALQQRLGPIDVSTDILPFTHTNYYDDELGTPLWRKFVSFARPGEAGRLAAIKLMTNVLEQQWTHRRLDRVARRVNLDPGYVTLAKLVLATTKDYAHRLYLGHGIYAEITLAYRDGDFRPLEWTYPDYRTAEYLEFFRRVRRNLEVLK